MTKQQSVAKMLRQIADDIEALPDADAGTIQFECNRPYEEVSTLASSHYREFRSCPEMSMTLSYQCRPFGIGVVVRVK